MGNINSSPIIVFDFETSGLSCETDEPVQIAALAIDQDSLEIIPDSEFESLMKPVNILTGTEAEIRTKWNKCNRAWDVNKKTREMLEEAPLPEHVFSMFTDYVKKYGSKPIPAGHNIQGFDMLWLDALARRFKKSDKQGKQQIFTTRIIMDTMNIAYSWFRRTNDSPESLKMDDLRDYFGMSKEGAHDALVDVRDTANVLIRFLSFQEKIAKKTKFRGSFRS